MLTKYIFVIINSDHKEGNPIRILKYNLRVRKIVGGKIPRLNSKCNSGLKICGINRKI
jgi:hypothetical protein